MNDARSTASTRPAATRRRIDLVAVVIACCSTLASTAAGAGDATAAPVDVVTAAAPPPAARPSPNHRHRTVYTCHEQGVTVLSDRPCGPLAVGRTVTTEEPPPGAAANTTPPTPRAATRPRSEPVQAARSNGGTTDRCAALQRELAEVDDRMRAGYTAREAGRLWDRRRDLKDRLRRERC